MICKECGLEIDDNSEFCTVCGAPQKLKEENAAPEATSVPENKSEASPEASTPVVPKVPENPEVSDIPEPDETQLSKKEIRELELEEALDRKNRMGILSGRSVYWNWALMSVPVLGWLIAIIWALGLCRKYQKRFLARAFLARILVASVFIFVGIIVYRIFGYGLDDIPQLIETVSAWIATIANKIF